MDLQQAIFILNTHNLVRNGKMCGKPSRKDVTEALHIAVEELRKIKNKQDAIDSCNGLNKRKVVLLKKDLTKDIIDKMNSLTMSNENEDIVCDFDYDLLTGEEYVFFSQFNNVSITKQKR